MELLGPSRLTKPGTLEARARANSSRVVAVTFMLDGHPLGSDTTTPYKLDVDPALLPAGRHRLRVAAVDSLGRRASSGPTALTIAPTQSALVKVSPGESFIRAKEALRGGNVTVQLGPGRYEVRELELGSGTRLVGSGPRTVIAPSTDSPY